MANAPEKKDDVDWKQFKPQALKLGLELGPLVIFYIVNARADIFAATAWFMGAMVVSLLLSWLLLHRVAVMPLVTAIVVLVFGSLTLWLKDDTFIKMKPTIVNALFGVTLLGGLAFGQSLLRYVFGEVYKLKPQGWTILTWRWGLFFLFLAVLNEVVWRGADAYVHDPKQATDLWVAFKVWATMPITVIFTLFQLPLLTKYAPDAETPAAPGGEPSI
ncbi:MAG TPA: septation protein A [Devosiaceae bacterium]|nr:septation protein A [Devosiaceae bacterium]